MSAGYAELHAKSFYSFGAGASHAHELLAQVKEYGYPALALTDTNLCGALEFVRLANSLGIRPITGGELTLTDGSHVTLLAKTRTGYSNISRLFMLANAVDRREPKLDPGRELVVGASERGFAVVALPGASAVTTALAASRLPTQGFVFLSFLPRHRTERIKLPSDLRSERRTLVAFETPHRLASSLSDLLETLGGRQIAVCRELTKLHEEVFRGSVSDALDHFTEPRDEFTLVIEGNPEQAETVPDAEVTSLLPQAKNRGMSARDAAY